MPLSVHDNLLVSYEVQCEARTITLHTEYRAKDKPTEFTKVIFSEVHGYNFQNDAFGNIIFGFETVPIAHFLRDYGAEISESYRMAGTPGPWAADMNTASNYLRDKKVLRVETIFHLLVRIEQRGTVRVPYPYCDVAQRQRI